MIYTHVLNRGPAAVRSPADLGHLAKVFAGELALPTNGSGQRLTPE
jgi:hypothetical protein